MEYKHEPTGADHYLHWHIENCENCLRFKLDPEDEYCTTEDSCKWEEQYQGYVWWGHKKPSEDILKQMFSLPLCSGLERSDIQDKIFPKE